MFFQLYYVKIEKWLTTQSEFYGPYGSTSKC